MSLVLRTNSAALDKQYYKPKFEIMETGDGSTSVNTLRIRMFLRHHFMLSCLYPNIGFLFDGQDSGEQMTVSYNDWRIPGRPPSISKDGQCFDSEIIIGFSSNKIIDKNTRTEGNTIPKIRGLSEEPYGAYSLIEYDIEDMLKSFSYFLPINGNGMYHNPMNVIFEQIDSTKTIRILRIEKSPNDIDTADTTIVRVTTDGPHGFTDGMCITITGITTPDGHTDSSTHMFGHLPGQRYMGDFKIKTSGLAANEFEYETYHLSNGEYAVTIEENPNMVAQVWYSYEYSDSISEIKNDGNNISVKLSAIQDDIFTFKVGDFVTIEDSTYYDSFNRKVLSFDTATNTLLLDNPDGLTGIPVNYGVIKYTSRIPSDDVPVNYKTATRSAPAFAHASHTTLMFAKRDSYYDVNHPSDSYGTDSFMYTNYMKQYSVVGFIPDGIYEKMEDDVMCEFGVYLNSASGTSGGGDAPKILIKPFIGDAEFSEDDIGSDIYPKIDLTHANIGHYNYNNDVQHVVKQFVRFTIDSDIANSIVAGKRKAYFCIDSGLQRDAQFEYITRNFRTDVITINERAPYLVLSVGSNGKENPYSSLEIDDTYMYYVCSEIKYDGSEYSVTVTPETWDENSMLYVNHNFVTVGDKLEILNTIHFDTVSATVTSVDFDGSNCVIKFMYDFGNNSVEPHSEPYAIIRNKSKMMSSYKITGDYINSEKARIITVPEISNDRKFADNSSFQLHNDEDIETLDVSVIPVNESECNAVSPVIITDIDIVNIQRSSSGRFEYVADGSEIRLSGINFDKISDVAYAVVGNQLFENGFFGDGKSYLLTKEYGYLKFTYSTGNGNNQLQLPILDVRNTIDKGTQFKIGNIDGLHSGDIASIISTPSYILGASSEYSPFPSSDDKFKYSQNYYIVIDADDNAWVSLNSKYVARIGDMTTPDSNYYIHLSDDEVEFISGLCANEDAPLIMYTGFTSICVADSNINTLMYKNRMYVQLDEYSPLAYASSDTVMVGDEFDIYVADLTGVTCDVIPVRDPVAYLAEDDTRLLKYTFVVNEPGVWVYTFTDISGNSTSVTINVTPRPASLTVFIKFEGVDIDSKTYTYTISGTHGYLSNSYAASIESSGIFVEGVNGKYPDDNVRIYPITEGEDVDSFKIVVTEDVVIDGGYLHLYVTTRERAGEVKSAEWCAPYVYSKNITCINPGTILPRFTGVNLAQVKIGGVTYKLSVPENWFTLVDSVDDDPSSMIVKLNSNYVGEQKFWPSLVSDTINPEPPQMKHPILITSISNPVMSIGNPSVAIELGYSWEEPGDIIAVDSNGNDISDSIVVTGNVDTDTAGTYKLTYTATDGCGNKVSADRVLTVTAGCSILIKTDKSTYTIGEDITILIDESYIDDAGLFNQNYLNNIVTFTTMDGNKIEADIVKATPDRKSITVKSPGILGSIIRVQVDTGVDNRGYVNCYLSNIITLSIVPNGELDIPLGTSMKFNSVNTIDSKFSHINYNPIYTKDLSYSRFSIVTDENSLIQNVYTILLTNLGERLYNDSFGSTLERRVFSIMDDINGNGKILAECINLISQYENRVSVSIPDSYVDYDAEHNTINISLYIRVPRGNARRIELTFRNDI